MKAVRLKVGDLENSVIRAKRVERTKGRERSELREGVIRESRSLWVVIILCLLVHDELIIDEVEAIGFGFPGAIDDELFLIWVQLWHLVNNLPGVLAIWNTEAKGEVEALQEVFLEIVSFYHPKVRYFFISHRELHSCTYCFEL